MGYWKQFAAWVTALKHKYWHDPFFRSKFSLTFHLLAFAVTLFVIASAFFNYLYQDVLRTLVGEIMMGIVLGEVGDANIVSSLEIAKSNSFVLFAASVFILTLIFVLLAIKIALRPAKNALNSQKRFISDIAHELRTPLAVIKANSEVALLDAGLDHKARKIMKSNIEELDRMSQIINNLLSIKNLIQPERIKFENVDLGLVVDGVIRKFGELSGKKGIQIVVKKITPNVVRGNTTALEQITTNILKNAITYTPKGGRITIRISPDYIGHILLHIEDTGIGITKKDLLHIFEPFYKADQSRRWSRGSSGLGLTIVSELVKMHSGRIVIRSAENKGTVAMISLPVGEFDKDERVEFAELNEISANFSDGTQV